MHHNNPKDFTTVLICTLICAEQNKKNDDRTLPHYHAHTTGNWIRYSNILVKKVLSIVLLFRLSICRMYAQNKYVYVHAHANFFLHSATNCEIGLKMYHFIVKIYIKLASGKNKSYHPLHYHQTSKVFESY